MTRRSPVQNDGKTWSSAAASIAANGTATTADKAVVRCSNIVGRNLPYIQHPLMALLCCVDEFEPVSGGAIWTKDGTLSAISPYRSASA